ncbi:MAG: hypothetical protein ACLU3I_00520 [Acutalibacteraceae bacterium]
MHDRRQYGTAEQYLNDYPIVKVACKTGTCPVAGHTSTARSPAPTTLRSCSTRPADDPEIAIAVYVEKRLAGRQSGERLHPRSWTPISSSSHQI